MEAVRRSLRAKRRALAPEAQAAAAAAVAARLTPLLEGVRRLGAYLAVGGELDPAPAVRWSWARGIEVFVPRLVSGGLMVFAPWQPDTEAHPGALGIPEPPPTGRVQAAGRLDSVLVPLVAFDRRGTRVGTGGGYYDRTFEFRRRQPRGSAPLLIGLAYAWQEVPDIEARAWDIPLDLVVTDEEVIRPA